MIPNFWLGELRKIFQHLVTKRKHSNAYSYFQSYCKKSKGNTPNKQCSLDLDVAYCVNLDIPNIQKFHHWHTIV